MENGKLRDCCSKGQNRETRPSFLENMGLRFREVHLLLPSECSDLRCETPSTEKGFFICLGFDSKNLIDSKKKDICRNGKKKPLEENSQFMCKIAD